MAIQVLSLHNAMCLCVGVGGAPFFIGQAPGFTSIVRTPAGDPVGDYTLVLDSAALDGFVIPMFTLLNQGDSPPVVAPGWGWHFFRVDGRTLRLKVSKYDAGLKDMVPADAVFSFVILTP